jgi:hypothetical protein
MSAFLDAYVECALWSSNDGSTDSGGEPMDDNYGADDIAPATREAMQKDCEALEAKAGALLDGIEASQAGHDFWLTRNRHSAGFWDRDLGEVGDKLTEIAHGFGGYDLYIGDDGLIHGTTG